MRAMKDSGVEWIGQIPEAWQIIPNKYVMRKIKDVRPTYQGEPILSLSQRGVLIRDLENPSGKMPLTFDGYQAVKKDNLLMCLFDIDVTPRCIGHIQNDGLCSPAYSHFQMTKLGYSRYFYYYYLNLDFTKELLHLAKNLRHSLTEDQLGAVPVPVPPLPEQTAIANYLDTQCERIDSIISKEEQVIEKLKEYKQSVITEAVTKGLNPDVPMKDSGIEWIGQIPEGWRVHALKYGLEYSGSGTTPKDASSYTDGEGVPWLNTGDLTDGLIHIIPKKITFEEQENNTTLKLYPSGSVVIAMYGATIGKLGVLTFPSTTNQACCALLNHQERLSQSYLFYLLRASRECLIVGAKGGGQPNISQSIIRDLPICSPPISEQTAIANYLDKKCAEIDHMIEKKQQLIEKLGEYKKSLIYEMVTGKREVPLC